MKRRLIQAVLVISTCLASWLGMMIVHETGHVVHAWMSGGRVVQVVLHPLAISRTDVDPNPRPLFVVWGGPIWGCLLPLAAVAVASRLRWRVERCWRFFAGFCLIANGAYLGSGYWIPVGDARQLVSLGTPHWLLLAFGMVTVCGGLILWHTLGPRFGLGNDRDNSEAKAALRITVVAVVIVLAEFVLSDQS
jgi:hypothetical protein